MNEDQKKALDTIEGQLYAINARNISMRYIAMRKTPTPEEISELNALLGFIIQEIRTLKETGKLDMDKVYEKEFGEGNQLNRVEVVDETGRAYVKWEDKLDVELSFQDGNRTLKVFIKPKV